MTAARQAYGAFGERLVATWYERRGATVLARNWRCREGELDLVVRDGKTIVFCEVKTRRTAAWGSGLEAVTSVKQVRLRRLAARWLAESGVPRSAIRFDVAAVTGARVEVVEGAF
jgi:putative endonuclease